MQLAYHVISFNDPHPTGYRTSQMRWPVCTLHKPTAQTHHTVFDALVLAVALGCTWQIERGVEIPPGG